MEERPSRSIANRPAPLRALLAGACALVLLGAAQASALSTPAGGSGASQPTAPSAGAVAATLEECVTAVAQSERAATFSGEMTAIPGTVRMSIRIDVEERAPGEAGFRAVTYPGLGVWRSADPKVKTYKYLKQVTNLSSPASYRGFVQFRWTGERGHTIKRAERITVRCLQPASPGEPPPSSAGGSGSSSGGSFAPAKA